MENAFHAASRNGEGFTRQLTRMETRDGLRTLGKRENVWFRVAPRTPIHAELISQSERLECDVLRGAIATSQFRSAWMVLEKARAEIASESGLPELRNVCRTSAHVSRETNAPPMWCAEHSMRPVGVVDHRKAGKRVIECDGMEVLCNERNRGFDTGTQSRNDGAASSCFSLVRVTNELRRSFAERINSITQGRANDGRS